MGRQGDEKLGQKIVNVAPIIQAGSNIPRCPTQCPDNEHSLFVSCHMTAVKATDCESHSELQSP